MTIYINKGMTNAAALTAQRMYENLAEEASTMNIEQAYTLADSQTPASYEGLAGMAVVTLEAETAEGAAVPIQGTYTKVEAVSVTYSDASGRYVATVIFS